MIEPKKGPFIRRFILTGSEKVTTVDIYSQDGKEERYDFINNDKLYKSFNKTTITDNFKKIIDKCMKL